jgi:hypothetical protein
MGALDVLKSERGLFTLLFLGVLAALMFTHAPPATIETWALYAGGVVSVYNVAKSIVPGARSVPPAPGTTTSTVEVKSSSTEVAP